MTNQQLQPQDTTPQRDHPYERPDPKDGQGEGYDPRWRRRGEEAQET